MIAYGYIRVSSSKQAQDDRLGLHRQREAIERYARTFGLELQGIYQDAITGTTATREGLGDLKAALAKRPGTVVIGETRAMARDLTVMFQTLSDLQALRAPVHSADMGLIDLKDEGSVIQFTTRAMMDHSERLRIVKRTYQSRIAMAEQGRMPSGAQMHGYKSVNGVTVIVPDEAEVVRYMFRRSAEGAGLRTIAAEVNAQGHSSPRGSVWRKGTIGRILRNPAYRGEAVWTQKQGRRKRFTFPMPPLVTEAQWHAAQPRTQGRAKPLDVPLAGFVKCARCGSTMSPERDKKSIYFRCSSRLKREIGQGRCGAGMVMASRLTAQVEEELRALLSDPEQVRAFLTAALENDPDALDLLADLERQDKEALELWRAGALSPAEFAAVRSDVAARRAALTQDREVDVAPYVLMAQEAPLPELLRAARVTVFAGKDEMRLELG